MIEYALYSMELEYNICSHYTNSSLILVNGKWKWEINVCPMHPSLVDGV
jgi:hypothetical protein